jgi:hypothetical protein
MHISYTGVIVPYIYHCPRAHFYRNIQKIRIEKEVEQDANTEISKRELGIQYHKMVSEYLNKEAEDFPFITDTILYYKEKPGIQVEKQLLFDTSFSPIKEKTKENFISITPDVYSFYNGCLEIADWKFANTEYNSAKYYGEVEFFLSGLASIYEISEAHVDIHFPEANYTLPRRSYSIAKITQIQQKNIMLIDRIINDKLWCANPTKNRCMFCDYRSADTGGSNHCDDSLI